MDPEVVSGFNYAVEDQILPPKFIPDEIYAIYSETDNSLTFIKMKKLFTLFVALVLSIGVKAQCPLTQAVDFSTIDHHGNEINLFEILDGGQYVLIDFFFTS